MLLKERYDSFTQRIAAYYCTLLAPKKENISLSGISGEAFSQLHDFFNELFKLLYEKPDTLVINVKEDVYLRKDEHKSKNQTFKKVEDALKPIIIDFIDFLYNAGQTGRISDNNFISDKAVYEKYISKRKREKLIFLEGLDVIGFQVNVLEDHVIFLNHKYPDMFKAMKVFSQRCGQNIHKQGRFCFFICDFSALDTQYEIKADEILNRIINCNSEYSYLLDLHKYLSSNGYSIECKPEADIALEVFYTNKKIKSSPLLGILFDIRYDEPVYVNMRFVSTARLTPISGTLSDDMQEAFFSDTGNCRGVECGWCKNQKGLLHPSKLTVKDKQKTICWYAQKSFSKVKEKDLNTIFCYIKFHEQLAL